MAITLSWPVDHTVYLSLAEPSLTHSVPMYPPPTPHPTHFTALVHKRKHGKLGRPPFNTAEREEAAIMNYP